MALGFGSSKKDDSKSAKKSQSDNGELTDKSPYYFSPSFMNHGGRFSSILQLYARVGSNRHMDFTDVISIIPVSPLEGVDMYMLINDSLITGDEKKRLIRNNASQGKEVIEDTQKNGPKEDKDSMSAQLMQKAEMEDYNEYEIIIDRPDPVVVYKIQLVLIADSQELIDEQIDMFNVSLAQRHEGLKWDSLGGDQQKRFTGLFEPLVPSRFDMTSTSRNYSNLNFTVSVGLVDPRGVPIGIDSMSLSASSSIFDFDGSLKEQAIIAAPKSSYMHWYAPSVLNGEEGDLEADNDNPPLASLMAQRAANQVVMNGKRVHHFVMNKFDYLDPETKVGYYRPKEALDEPVFKSYDVSKVTINPLQGFGDLSNVTNIYTRLVNKIVNIFDLLEDLNLTPDQRAVIRSAVEQFYFSNQLWVNDAELYPQRTYLVNITNPNTYPTMGQFIDSFASLAKKAATENNALKADRIETIQSILSQALTANMSVLGRPTSIEETDALQVYYNFGNIESWQIKQVQFINMIEYVIHTASPGDMIVIHGADRLYERVGEFVADAIESAKKRGIRFLFAFDTVTSKSTPQRISLLDIFKMKGKYYTDLDSEVDYTMIGSCLPDEVVELEKAMNTELSDAIRVHLQSKAPDQLLVHRRAGNVNNFVHAHVLV